MSMKITFGTHLSTMNEGLCASARMVGENLQITPNAGAYPKELTAITLKHFTGTAEISLSKDKKSFIVKLTATEGAAKVTRVTHQSPVFPQRKRLPSISI